MTLQLIFLKDYYIPFSFIQVFLLVYNIFGTSYGPTVLNIQNIIDTQPIGSVTTISRNVYHLITGLHTYVWLPYCLRVIHTYVSSFRIYSWNPQCDRAISLKTIFMSLLPVNRCNIIRYTRIFLNYIFYRLSLLIL